MLVAGLHVDDDCPTPVANLVEACSHLTSDDQVQRLDVSVEVARFLLSQPRSHVLEYERAEGKGRAASVRAQVMGVTVAGICFEGTESYALLLAAKLANDAAIEARHAR